MANWTSSISILNLFESKFRVCILYLIISDYDENRIIIVNREKTKLARNANKTVNF